MPSHGAPSLQTLLLTVVTMVFFAANSVLGRLALREDGIDPVSYTAIRFLSGAVVLAILAAVGPEGWRALRNHGSWRSALILFVYAIAFSFAYASVEAGVGALILFGAVQTSMIGAGMVGGEHPSAAEWGGLALALAGLVYLLSPGLTAPPLLGAILMTVSGAAWGFYSMAARSVRSPAIETAGNFARVAPMTLAAAAWAALTGEPYLSSMGVLWAVVSGAITSGLGYILWYTALRGLTASRAAVVQLTVPILAAAAGVLFLGEALNWRLVLGGAAILGGAGLALLGRFSLR